MTEPSSKFRSSTFALAVGPLLLGACVATVPASNEPARTAAVDHRPQVETFVVSSDEATSSVELGAPSNLGTQDFTVSHWYTTTFSTPGSLGDVIGNRQASSHGNFLSVRLRGDGVLSLEVDEDDAGTRYGAIDSGQRRVNDGVWHHLAYTRRGGELTLYVDGERIARSGSASAPAANLLGRTPFRLGRSLPPCCANFVAIAGAYAEVRILPGRAMTDDELRADYVNSREVNASLVSGPLLVER